MRGALLRWGFAVGLAVLASCRSTGDRAGRDHAPTTTDRHATNVSASTRAVDASALLPARIRRLANAEYDATVGKLLATSTSPAAASDFPPDFRQAGFTVNEAQRIDAVLVERLAEAADALATEARSNGTLARLAPCRARSRARSCARAFIATFAPKVYRRPLTDEEAKALLALYAVAADGATYEDGVAHVLRGLLQSAGLLYLTELGGSSSDGTITLTPYEIASSISYFLTSAPPDDELLAKAAAGALSDPTERETQARRLLQNDPLAQEGVVRLVREWLGIDRIDDTGKDSLVYPGFAEQKPKIVAESKEFVRTVAFRAGGTVSELLGATWTVDAGPLTLYRTAGPGPVPGSSRLVERVGILNQAAFLATYANAHESHPVFRGVAVARRVACLPLDSPTSFDIIVVPPVPDPGKTTRERFHVHSQDSLCQLCHSLIDPLGFAFEHFDGMGGLRSHENGRPVDSAVLLAQRTELDGRYADSNQLAAALARSESARDCFARFMFRAGAATGKPAGRLAEAEFLNLWRANPAAARGNIVETLIAFVKRPAFTKRRPE